MSNYKDLKYNFDGSGLSGITSYDDDTLQANVALLGFKTALNNDLAKYSLQDQVIDEFETVAGIDASASTNEFWGDTASPDQNAYSGVDWSPGETLTAYGGKGGDGDGGDGGTATGGATQATGGAGGTGGATGTDGADGPSNSPGGGGGGGGTAGGGDGGDGTAAWYTGGGGGGGGDWDTSDGASGAEADGGSGYKAGGQGGTYTTHLGADGEGEGGTGPDYGGGQAGAVGAARKNNGGGGGWPGGGGGGGADYTNSGAGCTGGDGADGGVIIVYTNSGTQIVKRFSGTSFTVPSGSTDLIVYAIGGGGGGGHDDHGGISGDGGGGGGLAKSNTFSSPSGRVITYSIGAGGEGTDEVQAGDGGTTTCTIGPLQGGANNLTLQSVDTAAAAVPTSASMVLLMENGAGTATLNTDIKGYISRNSGSSFTQGTLVDEGLFGDKRILAFHDLDISGQSSGTAMCWKITTHNQSTDSKETYIHAVSIGWK